MIARGMAPTWRLVAAVAVAASALGAVAAPAHAGESRQLERNCDLGPTGAIPLPDLGTGTYRGAQGGLYPLGSNEAPPAHLAVGIERASAITPRNAAGEPDPQGAIGVASVGFSNSHREFAEFLKEHGNDPAFDPAVAFANLAQGGQHIASWASEDSRAWRQAEEMLAAAGLTAPQVQVLWVKMAERRGVAPDEGFPGNALRYEAELTDVLRLLQRAFPNLHVAYVSSRVFGGYNDTTSPSPEPIAYEEGFGVKWTIESQIAGTPDLNADPGAGDVAAPWIVWGPYLWADGVTSRSDGLDWQCRDFRGDGVHTAGPGLTKVADALMSFLQTEPTAAPLFAGRDLPAAPTDLGDPIPTSTIAGAAPPPSSPTTTAARSDPPATAAQDGETGDRVSPASPSERPRTSPADRARSRETSLLAWALMIGATTLLLGAGVVASLMRRRKSSESGEGRVP